MANIFSYLKSKAQQSVGAPTAADKYQQQIGRLEEKKKQLQSSLSVSENDIAVYEDFINTIKEIKSNAEEGLKKDPSRTVSFGWTNIHGLATYETNANLLLIKSQIVAAKIPNDIANVNIKYQEALKQAILDYINDVLSQIIEDKHGISFKIRHLNQIISLHRNLSGFDRIRQIVDARQLEVFGEIIEACKIEYENALYSKKVDVNRLEASITSVTSTPRYQEAMKIQEIIQRRN